MGVIMTTIVFDTLAFSKKLRAAGVPEKQAEVQAEALAEIFDENLATKKDLKQLENALKKDIKELEQNQNLKMAELKNELIKWVFGISMAQAAIIISTLKFFH